MLLDQKTSITVANAYYCLNKYYGSVSGAMLKVIRVRRNIGLGEDCYDVLEESPTEILLLSDDAAQCLHHARVISTILLGFVTLLLVANHELIVGYYLLRHLWILHSFPTKY